MGRLRRHGPVDDNGPEVDVEAVMAIATVEEMRRTLGEIQEATGKTAAEVGISVADWYRRQFGIA